MSNFTTQEIRFKNNKCNIKSTHPKGVTAKGNLYRLDVNAHSVTGIEVKEITLKDGTRVTTITATSADGTSVELNAYHV